MFLPYMFGERSPIWDGLARGVFFGLSLASTKADMVRAILEGAAYGLRHNLQVAQAAGFSVSGMSCVGGGARSALWNQIKADVLGMPVRLPAAATGAAMGDTIMAGVGAGVYRDFAEAKAAVVRIQREILPNEANRRTTMTCIAFRTSILCGKRGSAAEDDPRRSRSLLIQVRKV